MVESEQVVAEQMDARADLTWDAVGEDAEEFVLGAKLPVAVIREDVQLARLVSLLSWL